MHDDGRLRSESISGSELSRMIARIRRSLKSETAQVDLVNKVGEQPNSDSLAYGAYLLNRLTGVKLLVPLGCRMDCAIEKLL